MFMSGMSSVDSDHMSAPLNSKNMQGKALADAMIKLGVPSNIVRVLLCIHVHGATTSKDLQTRCNLRQPEISTAIKTLSQHSLVEVKHTGAAGRGRPSHVYDLRKPIEACIQHFTEEIEQTIAKLKNGVSEVERLTRGL